MITLDRYEWNQSTQQCFWFGFEFEDYEPAEGDIISAWNGTVCVGAGEYSVDDNAIIVPVMGTDGEAYSLGYCTAGTVPVFKMLRDDEEIEISFEAWDDGRSTNYWRAQSLNNGKFYKEAEPVVVGTIRVIDASFNVYNVDPDNLHLVE